MGLGKDDSFFVTSEPTKIASTGTTFTKIFGLRDSRTSGALDVNNDFWVWGNRKTSTSYTLPTKIVTSKKFDQDAIFVNTNEFILKELSGGFYQTKLENAISSTITNLPSTVPNSAISVSVFGDSLLYIKEDLFYSLLYTPSDKCVSMIHNNNIVFQFMVIDPGVKIYQHYKL